MRGDVPGCCVGDVCQAGDTDEACGAKGAACASCGLKACKAGACAPVVVLFGGENTEYALASTETWTYDGDAWKKRITASPTPRAGGGMATLGDAMFFGFGSNPTLAADPFRDLWKWDGRRWTSVFTNGLDPSLPPPREDP